jgi:signal peptidase I
MFTKLLPKITAALGGAFAILIYLMLKGRVATNFSAMLLLMTIVTGIYWLAERYYFRKQRESAASMAVEQLNAREAKAASEGIKIETIDKEATRQALLRQPWWLEWTAGLFGVIAAVFFLRSFIAEPFRVPSGSMLPTIVEGDLILVNKFIYGTRLPVANTKLWDNKNPQRGDIMVFHLPKDPSIDYIKRVVGVPGDTISYLNKRLSINGALLNKDAQPEYLEEQSMRYAKQFEEKTGEVTHKILNYEQYPPFISSVEEFPLRDNCTYSSEGVVCKVPAGHYFMMGDNRDNSMDSRYWGFVPEANIVGKAFFVWFNLNLNFKRIGTTFH